MKYQSLPLDKRIDNIEEFIFYGLISYLSFNIVFRQILGPGILTMIFFVILFLAYMMVLWNFVNICGEIGYRVGLKLEKLFIRKLIDHIQKHNKLYRKGIGFVFLLISAYFFGKVLGYSIDKTTAALGIAIIAGLIIKYFIKKPEKIKPKNKKRRNPVKTHKNL